MSVSPLILFSKLLHCESRYSLFATNRWFTKQQDYIQAKLTVSEQEDMLTRLQHLHSLVSTPLKDLGKNDPPSGLDLPDLDSSATSEATVLPVNTG